MPFSDPARWFYLGRHLPEQFATANLAFLFSAVLWTAIQLVGIDAAFLINIPIVALFFCALYVLGLCIMEGNDRTSLRMHAAIGILLAYMLYRHQELVLAMANPYRDPLAHLFAVVSMIMMARSRGKGRQCVVAVFVLALACSTRETYALLIPCYILYVWTGQSFRLSRRLVAILFVLAVVLSIGLIPFFIQNYLATGIPFISGQGVRALGLHKQQYPWMSLSYLSRNASGMADYLIHQLAWPPLVLASVGLLRAVRQRHYFVLTVALPAAVFHLFLYMAYHTLFARYLFTSAIFMYPVAAYGLAGLLALLSKRGERIAYAISLLGAIWVLAGLAFARGKTRFQLDHVRGLRKAIVQIVGTNALILGERPIPEIARCFLDQPAIDTQSNVQSSLGGLPAQLWRGAVQGHEAAYYIGRDSRIQSYLRMIFDLEPVSTIDANALHLDNIKELALRGELEVLRVRPWSNAVTEVAISAAAGEYHLGVNPGIWSSADARSTRIAWNGEPLDVRREDYLRYYRVRVAPGDRQGILRIESDRPVPGQPAAALIPVESPIHLKVSRHTMPFFINRFSADWSVRRGEYGPSISSNGTFLLPTPEAARSYLVNLGVRWVTDKPRGRVRVRAGEEVLYDGIVDHTLRGSSRQLGFVLPAEKMAGPETEVELEISPAEQDADEVRLMLEEVAVRELPVVAARDLKVGQSEADPF